LNGKVVIDPDLFDLDHVEVLRVPRNALWVRVDGGTIKMVTAEPDLKNSAAPSKVFLRHAQFRRPQWRRQSDGQSADRRG